MSEKLTVGRIQELTSENSKLREANRRLQVAGPALQRDKLIQELTRQLEEMTASRDLWKQCEGECNEKFFEMAAEFEAAISELRITRKVADASLKYYSAVSGIEIEEEEKRLGLLWDLACEEYRRYLESREEKNERA